MNISLVIGHIHDNLENDKLVYRIFDFIEQREKMVDESMLSRQYPGDCYITKVN